MTEILQHVGYPHPSPLPNRAREQRTLDTSCKFFLISFLFFISHIPLLYAAFKDPGFGARPAGMGNAFVGLSDDVNAPLYNPAGATQAAARQTAFSYARPFAGLDDVDIDLNFFSSVIPVSDLGAVGLSWTNLSESAYRADTAALLFATSLNRWIPQLGPSVSIGGNVRYLHHKFDQDDRVKADSVFSGGLSRGGSAFDLGVWIKPEPRTLPGLSLGLVGKSLNEPDLGLTDRDVVPREITGGAAYTFRKITFAFDVSRRDSVTDWRAGLETWMLRDTVGLRAGAHSTAATAGFTYLFQAGSRLALFLDYAYAVPFYVEENSGSHRAALGVLW